MWKEPKPSTVFRNTFIVSYLCLGRFLECVGDTLLYWWIGWWGKMHCWTTYLQTRGCCTDMWKLGAALADNPERVEFRILRRGEKGKSQGSNFDFRRTDLSLILLGKSSGRPWTEEASGRANWFSRITSSKFKNGPSPHVANQEKAARGLQGRIRRFWLNSKIKKKCIK